MKTSICRYIKSGDGYMFRVFVSFLPFISYLYEQKTWQDIKIMSQGERQILPYQINVNKTYYRLIGRCRCSVLVFCTIHLYRYCCMIHSSILEESVLGDWVYGAVVMNELRIQHTKRQYREASSGKII